MLEHLASSGRLKPLLVLSRRISAIFSPIIHAYSGPLLEVDTNDL